MNCRRLTPRCRSSIRTDSDGEGDLDINYFLNFITARNKQIIRSASSAVSPAAHPPKTCEERPVSDSRTIPPLLWGEGRGEGEPSTDSSHFRIFDDQNSKIPHPSTALPSASRQRRRAAPYDSTGGLPNRFA